MELFAGLSVGLLVLTAWAVVFKTFTLWLRTRGLPELLLTLYLTCATAVGYPLAVAMSVVPAAEHAWVHVLANLVMSAGWISLLLFNLHVFRLETFWAQGLVFITTCLIGWGAFGYIHEVTGPSPRPPQEIPGVTLLLSVPVGIAYLWTTLEAFSYYRMLRRRLGLGLADSAVVNRVFLWGLMTLSALVALVVSMVGVAAGSYMSASTILFSSACGLVHASSLFLAFHPPAWYRAWLQRGPASAEVA